MASKEPSTKEVEEDEGAIEMKRPRPKPDISLQEARLIAARGKVEQRHLHEAMRTALAFESNARGLMVATKRGSSEEKEATKAWERSKYRNEGFMEMLAADPSMRPHLLCWMVDFSGSEEPAWVRSSKGPTPNEVVRAIYVKEGTIGPHVSRWLDKHQFLVSDSGSGVGGWDLGVPCDDKDAEKLCRLAHDELHDFLAADVLTVQLRFWGWRFKKRLTLQEAKKLVANIN